MRVTFAACLFGLLAVPLTAGCEKKPSEERGSRAALAQSALAQSALAQLPASPPPRPLSSEVAEFEKSLQVGKLVVPPRGADCPLAFGKGMLGQLTKDALRVFDTASFGLVGTEPLEGPRIVVAMADGALLAVGASTLLRWEPGKKHPTRLPRPTFLPRARLYPDAQQLDRIWVFDDGVRVGGAAATVVLVSYRLPLGPKAETDSLPSVLLPEQELPFASPRFGVFGPTREGVWLYLALGQIERFSPGGLRLPGLKVGEVTQPTWMLPARRLDQSWWVEQDGHVSRTLVTPIYKHLQSVKLAGNVVAVASGNEGRILAAVVVTGPGPRFELELLDQDLAPAGRVVLPADAPTGTDRWVSVVTENQAVAVAARAPRVAVGGPDRAIIFDAEGHQLFSIASK